ncbi:hypothetical protein Q9K01_15155 [Qipengyuania sp. DY56-A-20]|jgi:hypothetical protein|uniref:Uncharacterized protein n=1 Tax=Qipengyuania benthica TaxID=3067651 RepID=A0ABT9HCB0_9SPHN|nr:hypothetical protein [Qipengyuania sp. DY56-A-20]
MARPFGKLLAGLPPLKAGNRRIGDRQKVDESRSGVTCTPAEPNDRGNGTPLGFSKYRKIIIWIHKFRHRISDITSINSANI